MRVGRPMTKPFLVFFILPQVFCFHLGTLFHISYLAVEICKTLDKSVRIKCETEMDT
jgi:hypothetical protein